MTTLRKLPKSPYDLHTKALIAQTAVVKALYGAHCYVTGEQVLNELRSGITDALVGLHQNINPYLATNLLSGMITDPELYLIQQALRFAREFLLHADESTRQGFLRYVTCKTHKSQGVTGPAGALAVYLAKVGWQLNQEGQLLIAAFFQLDLMWSPWEDILQALEYAWMQHVATSLSSRKGYRGMPVPDRHATLNLVKNLPEKTLTIASYAITGGYMLQHQKTKFNADATDDCPYCEGQEDTHQHRVLECPLTQHVREKFGPTCQFFQDHDPILITCPILYMEPEWELHRQMWHALPEPDFHLPDFAFTQEVYTDGTCQFPAQPHYRHAANSAVCLRPDRPNLQDLLALDVEQQLEAAFHVICVGLLPGKQTIARAELHIIVRLAESGHPGPYVTDSQYVLNVYKQIQRQPDWRALHTKPNFDLIYRWHVVYWTAQSGPQIYKVKSHLDPTTHMDPTSQMRQIGNAVADEAAKQALKNLAKTHHAALAQGLAEQQLHAEHLHNQFLMRFEMAVVCVHFDRPEIVVTNAGDPTKFLQQMKEWQPPGPASAYSFQAIPEQVVHASRWGTKFTDLLLQWLASLTWPAPAPANLAANMPVGISWIELIFNFLLTTQVEIPVNIAPYKQESCYVTSDETVHDLTTFDFSHTIMSFQRAVEHVQFLSNMELAPKTGKTKTGSLYYLGAGTCRNGYNTRPALPLQSETMDFLWDYMTHHRTDSRVQFEALPKPPSREPIFTCRYQQPHGNTPRDRAKRYAQWRVHIKTLREGGSWVVITLILGPEGCSISCVVAEGNHYLLRKQTRRFLLRCCRGGAACPQAVWYKCQLNTPLWLYNYT